MLSSYPTLITVLTTLVIMLGPTGLLIGGITLARRFYKRRKVNPLTKNLLRPAGYSLQKQIFDLQLDLFAMLSCIPLIISVMIMQMLMINYLKHASFTNLDIAVVCVLTLLAVGYAALKVVRIAKRLQHVRLGYDCELAVGQELESVIRPVEHPFRVYHDIPFSGFNVDHLIVGRTGVFVVETKGRSKPISDGEKQFRVRYENNALHFPNHVETKPIEQVRSTVDAVRKWLSESTGLDVSVGGILVLPGWFVELKQRPTCPYIVSGSALSSLFSQLRVGELDLAQIKAISYQVEQRVRDVTRSGDK